MIKVIYDLELLPPLCYPEVTYLKDAKHTVHVKGIVDLQWDNSFAEVKLTGKPEWYLNTWFAAKQLEIYFYVSGLDKGWMLPIRWPQARFNEDKENIGEFIERLKKDIYKRPKFYFPEYDKNREPPKFGRCFYRTEFENGFPELERKLIWTRGVIRQCAIEDYWPQRYNCMYPGPCDFLQICSTGYINEKLYEKKEN